MKTASGNNETRYEAPKVTEIGNVGELVQGSDYGDMDDGGLQGSGKMTTTLQTFV